MHSDRLDIVKIATCIAVLLLLSSPGYPQRAGGEREFGEIAIVVNSSNPTEDLSVAEVRRILLGERMFWAGNVQIKLVLRERGAKEREQVLSRLLKMNDEAFDGHWRAKVFRGEAPGEPLAVTTTAQVAQYVTRLPGAIAFMPVKSRSSELKIVKLEGRLPGETGYILK